MFGEILDNFQTNVDIQRASRHLYLVMTKTLNENAAGEKGLNLAEILKGKAPGNGEKKVSKGRRWKVNTAKFVLGDWRKKDSSGLDGKSSSKTTAANNHTNSGLDPHDSMAEVQYSDLTLLQCLALNALDLTAPASDILLKNRRNNWVQLSGHEGAFSPAGPGTIWKKRTCPDDDAEVRAYERLMRDIMHDMVPCFYKEVEWNGDYYIEMQDLLHEFKDPSVMDIKIGTRTFAESEVTNQTARLDLYQKMIKVDPSAPTLEEHSAKAVTKLRYMTFREQQSSSSTLGFRIEALKLEGAAPLKDLKLVKTWDEVLCTMGLFLSGQEDCKTELVRRFREMRDKFEQSEFFRRHEIVGSSILLIHDKTKCGAWMIDFVKAFPLPDDVTVTHRSPWVCGNREDGYLTGLDNLIQILEEVTTSQGESRRTTHQPSSSNFNKSKDNS